MFTVHSSFRLLLNDNTKVGVQIILSKFFFGHKWENYQCIESRKKKYLANPEDDTKPTKLYSLPWNYII